MSSVVELAAAVVVVDMPYLAAAIRLVVPLAFPAFPVLLASPAFPAFPASLASSASPAPLACSLVGKPPVAEALVVGAFVASELVAAESVSFAAHGGTPRYCEITAHYHPKQAYQA